ncbi:MAG: TonB-dependent receptor [Edaphobacter sp.]|uniref:TonB-dependent receptor n=1 Tax=Edaphobacter sp. TaxID=1934404 RepID=UPI002395B35B|nr:TonB-dependent receptor [Edaphobacter sp.]MDE1176115.1 TonB-dependent receptor [Edaphobacter sp.]
MTMTVVLRVGNGMTARTILRSMLAGAVLLGAGYTAQAQDAAPATQGSPAAQLPAQTAVQAAGGTIRGSIKAGAIPLPGVAVTATNTLTGKKYATTTDVSGAFAMTIPKNGRYVVKTELAAFASETQEVLINAASENGGKPEQTVSITLQLASRVQQQEELQQKQQAAASSTLAGAVSRGMQSLNVTGSGGDLSDASAGTANSGAQMPTLAGLGGDSAATDSVAVSGQMGQTNGLANFNEDEVRERIEDAMARARQQGGAQSDMVNAVAGMLGGMMGPGGGPGGGGRGGGGLGMRGGGGGRGRGFDPTQPHGAIFYQGGNGALDATTFSLTGAPVTKPSYSNNRFGLSFTGSPYIPGLIKPSSKQFIFLNVTGQRNTTPQNLYGTVPTEAERGGDFSSLSTPLYDPSTSQQFACNGVLNVICGNRISPQSQALMKYYPAPNIATTGAQGYNYQTVTTAGQNAVMAAMRYVRNFGQSTGFGPFGGGGGGGRRQSSNGPKTLTQNINFNGSYSHSAADNRNIFLPLGGSTASDGYNISAGYTVGYGKLRNNATLTWNRSHATTLNYFTNGTDNPAADAGVLVGNATVAANPFYYGVPTLTFTGLTGLSSTTPSDSVSQTISFTDFVSWNIKKHNMRFGGDFRRLHVDTLTAPGNLQSGASPLGSFTFSGYATQHTATSSKDLSNGYGFADFLLGMPQQAAVQAGLQKTYLRANIWDLYANDDWRILPSLTLNYGLRYEYFSPYSEKNNRLANLDHNADFSQVAAVTPGQTGPYSGMKYSNSLVNNDRTMFSPRFGFAYRIKGKLFGQTVLRGGYGINYNTQQYSTFARQLAFQPPFAVTQTNIVNQQGCGVLQFANAFNCSTAAVQNNYSVNPNYRLGHVQVWNIDMQRTLPLGIVLNVGYNGAKGGALDIVRAPNRTAASVLDPTAQVYYYEDSQGFSRFNALSINARKRMQKGVSLQATYQYGHSIDNASSIGGSTVTPAQNDQNLAAEEGNSSFDIRQKLTGNWVLELPFGPNRAFLANKGVWSKVFDGFSLSGDFTFATGNYFTPHYSATVSETATGTNNTLRPDRVFTQPISGNGTILDWFNPGAFATPADVFGTASRGSIRGPGTVAVDTSLSRTVAMGETRSFEARMTATNVFNTVQYSGIDTTLNSRTFGQVTSTAAMRRITFIARYRF